MKINKDTYTVKFTTNGSECSFTGKCESFDVNRIRIFIIDDDKIKNLNLFMEWVRSYSDNNWFNYRCKNDVTLINSDNVEIILHNSVIISVDFGESMDEFPFFELIYDIRKNAEN